MRRTIIALLTALSAWALGIADSRAQNSETEPTGRQIMDGVRDRHERKHELTVDNMTLTDRRGDREVRSVRKYVIKLAEDEYRHLIVFEAPEGVRGVSLLTWQHDEAEDDQWLHLPSLGPELKRIAEGARRTYFMGTDYTYEDLGPEDLDDYRYERHDDQMLDEIRHMVVDAFPARDFIARSTGYSRRRMFVRADLFFITRIDYFDRRGGLIKRQLVTELEPVDGEAWRSRFTEMVNFQEEHTTLTETRERRFDPEAVPEQYFTQRYVVSGRVLD